MAQESCESAAEVLDVRGLACPLPVLRAKKALRAIPVGSILRIEATDPKAAKDFPVFCEQTGHELVESDQRNGILIFAIRRTR